MAMTQNSVVVGVFPDQDQARHAIEELRRAGFSDDELGFLTRVGVADRDEAAQTGTMTGIVSGGILGSVLGAAVALLIPGFGPALAGGILAASTALGAAAGGIIGTLTSLGVPDSEARYYQRELETGHTIVTVKIASDHQSAEAILRDSGATSVKSHIGVFNAVPPQRPFGAPPDTYDPTADNPSETKP